MQHLQLVCILSIIIAIAQAGGDSKEEEEKLVEECRIETGASDDDVKNFNSDEFPKTESQYCLTACYYRKAGLMDDDNKIYIDKALDDMADLKKHSKKTYDKLVSIMKDCNAKYTPVKKCDSMQMYLDCLLKSAKEAGIPLEK